MKQNILFSIVSFFVFLIASSQQLDPLLTKDYETQRVWVNELMDAMSVDEKIGQLFMIQAYSNKGTKHRRFIESEIKKYHIGGLIFMQGTPEKQAELNNRYQGWQKKWCFNLNGKRKSCCICDI